jgi:hypothetical protein
MIEKQDKENRRESEVVFSFKPGERYMVVDAGGMFCQICLIFN